MRIDYPDSIIYTVERIRNVEIIYSDSTTRNFYHDTIHSKIEPNPDFDKLPEEPVIHENHSYRYLMQAGALISKIYDMGESFNMQSDSCWKIGIWDGCIAAKRYIKGLGGPYSSCWGGISCSQKLDEAPVYYKKANFEWGVPLIINEISSFSYSSKIFVYPNPADNWIYINSNALLTFWLELIDLNGTIVMKEKVSSKQQINLQEILQGLYIYRITGDDLLLHGKLIIK